LALIAVAVAATLAHAPLVVARKGGAAEGILVGTTRPASACQSEETLPRDTTALRLSLTAALGPRVAVKALSGSRVLTRGTVSPGWSGASVEIPVKPVSRTLAPVEICFATTLMNGRVTMRGSRTGPALAARSKEGPLPGRMGVEYLRPGTVSWWSRATSVARRLGLGRAASGTWNALLVMALAASFITLSSWLVLREIR
jgi:hypothetical protein